MDPILLLLIVFAVMMLPMFLMSGRQRKAQRQQQEMIATLGVGDEVRTHSGFYGLIVEEFGDTVVLESENGAQLKWARAAISMKVDPADGTPVVEEDPAEPVATGEGPADEHTERPASDRPLTVAGSRASADREPGQSVLDGTRADDAPSRDDADRR